LLPPPVGTLNKSAYPEDEASDSFGFLADRSLANGLLKRRRVLPCQAVRLHHSKRK
jgi:hypothetical protein